MSNLASSARHFSRIRSSDGWASFSNFGSLVDILAPGVSITSDWNTSNTSIKTIGTLPQLGSKTVYYWHVNATNANGTSAYSSTFSFRTRRN